MTSLNHTDREAIEQLLIGRTVTKVTDDTLLLDDGTYLTFHGNDGCGGCSNGEYNLTHLEGADNIITNVEFLDASDDGMYSIFVYAAHRLINLVQFTGDDGNGYYGTGYTITITKPPSREPAP